MLQRCNSLILIWFLLAVFCPSLLRAVIQGRFWVKCVCVCVCVCVCACVCLWHRKLLTNSQARERERERQRQREAGVTRKRIGGGIQEGRGGLREWGIEQKRVWSCSSREIKAFLSLCRRLRARDTAEEWSQPRERRVQAACCHWSSWLRPISRPQNTNAQQDKTHSWTRMQKGSHSWPGDRPTLQAHTHTQTLSWTATHLPFLKPLPYQSDQSSHACLTEPRLAFSWRRPVFLFLLYARLCYLRGHGVRTLSSLPLPLCCVEFGTALHWTLNPFGSVPDTHPYLK